MFSKKENQQKTVIILLSLFFSIKKQKHRTSFFFSYIKIKIKQKFFFSLLTERESKTKLRSQSATIPTDSSTYPLSPTNKRDRTIQLYQSKTETAWEELQSPETLYTLQYTQYSRRTYQSKGVRSCRSLSSNHPSSPFHSGRQGVQGSLRKTSHQ